MGKVKARNKKSARGKKISDLAVTGRSPWSTLEATPPGSPPTGSPRPR